MRKGAQARAGGGAAEQVVKEGFTEGAVSTLNPEGCKAGQGKGWWQVGGTDEQQVQRPQSASNSGADFTAGTGGSA